MSHTNLFFGFWFHIAEISLVWKKGGDQLFLNPGRETLLNSRVIRVCFTFACLIAVADAKERSQLFLLLPEDLPVDQGGDEGGEEGGGAGEGDAGGGAACLGTKSNEEQNQERDLSPGRAGRLRMG